MTLHPLDDAIERVRRASKDLDELRSNLAPLRGEQYRVVVEHRTATMNEVRTDLTWRISISMIAPILIGEVCYNLRSALDYLIHELTNIDTGPPKHKTQFPIEDGKNGFLNRKNTWLKGLNERHVAAIERLQPYNGRDWMKTLREVSNPDKHREITPAKGDISVIMFVKEETAGYGTLPLPAYRAPHPVTGVEVEMKLHVSGSILFSDGAPVIETLEKLILKTSETLEAFKSEFNIG